MASCLIVLAELDALNNQYLVCRGAPKHIPGRLVERSSAFYPEGVHVATLSKDQLVPFRDPASSVPKTLQEVNHRHAWKLSVATAKCIAEIHHAMIEGRHPGFDAFVDTHVCNWPREYITSGLKLIIIWEDNKGYRHTSVSPCISQLVRYCSGATSVVPAAHALETTHVLASSVSEPSAA